VRGDDLKSTDVRNDRLWCKPRGPSAFYLGGVTLHPMPECVWCRNEHMQARV